MLYEYLGRLLKLKSMGAVVMTLALSRPLMAESGTYWLNIPATSLGDNALSARDFPPGITKEVK